MVLDLDRPAGKLSGQIPRETIRAWRTPLLDEREPTVPHCLLTSVAAALFCLAAGAGPARADDTKPPADKAVTPQQVQEAAERGLVFLEKDAAKWRKERQCATCHHGTMTVWAYAEARSQGYSVAAETLAETAKWTKERLERIDQPRDPRPGWKMVNTPAIYLALIAQAVPKQEVVSAEELKQIAGHLVRHQEAD